MFNWKQKLRFMCNEYGWWLKIDNLYDKMKKYVWNVEKAEDLWNERIAKLENSYKFWIQWLESWNINAFDEKLRILDRLQEWKEKMLKNW